MSKIKPVRLTHNQANCLAFLRNNGGTAFAVNADSVRAFNKLVALGLAVVAEDMGKAGKTYKLVSE